MDCPEKPTGGKVLLPVGSGPESPFGAMRGEFEMKEGWDMPLDDADADAFWEGEW